MVDRCSLSLSLSLCNDLPYSASALESHMPLSMPIPWQAVYQIPIVTGSANQLARWHQSAKWLTYIGVIDVFDLRACIWILNRAWLPLRRKAHAWHIALLASRPMPGSSAGLFHLTEIIYVYLSLYIYIYREREIDRERERETVIHIGHSGSPPCCVGLDLQLCVGSVELT